MKRAAGARFFYRVVRFRRLITGVGPRAELRGYLVLAGSEVLLLSPSAFFSVEVSAPGLSSFFLSSFLSLSSPVFVSGDGSGVVVGDAAGVAAGGVLSGPGDSFPVQAVIAILAANSAASKNDLLIVLTSILSLKFFSVLS
jgi:hypothetical protein